MAAWPIPQCIILLIKINLTVLNEANRRQYKAQKCHQWKGKGSITSSLPL